MVCAPFMKDGVQEKILFRQPLPAHTKAGRIFKALDDFISRVIFIGADDGARESLLGAFCICKANKLCFYKPLNLTLQLPTSNTQRTK